MSLRDAYAKTQSAIASTKGRTLLHTVQQTANARQWKGELSRAVNGLTYAGSNPFAAYYKAMQEKARGSVPLTFGNVSTNLRSDAFQNLFGNRGGVVGDSANTKHYRAAEAAEKRIKEKKAKEAPSTKSPFADWAKRTKALEGSGSDAKIARRQAVAKLEAENLKAKERALKQEKIDRRRNRIEDDAAARRKRQDERHLVAMQNMRQQGVNAQLREQMLRSRLRNPPNGLTTGNPNSWGGGFLGATAMAAAGGFGVAPLWQRDVDLLSGKISLQSVLGFEQGEVGWQWLQNQGQDLGFDWLESVPQFARFMAVASPKLGYEESTDIFQAVSELATVRKLKTFQRQRVYKAFGDMFGKNDISMQELRVQLAEGGFPDAYILMERAWESMPGSTKGGFAKAVADPNKPIIPSEIMPIFVKLLREQTAPSIKYAKQSSIASHGRMKGSLSTFFKEFFKDVFDDSGKVVGGGDIVFKNLWKEFDLDIMKLTSSAAALAKVFEALMVPVKAFTGLVAEFSKTTLPRLSDTLGISQEKIVAFGAVVTGLFFPWTRWLTVLSLVVMGVEDLIYALNGKESVLLDFFGDVESVERFATAAGIALVALKGISLLSGSNALKDSGSKFGVAAWAAFNIAALAAAASIGYAIGTAIRAGFSGQGKAGQGWDKYTNLSTYDWFIEKNIADVEYGLGWMFGNKEMMQRSNDWYFGRQQEEAERMKAWGGEFGLGPMDRETYEKQKAASDAWNRVNTPPSMVNPQGSVIVPDIKVGDIVMNVNGNVDMNNIDSIKQSFRDTVKETVGDMIAVAKMNYTSAARV